MELSYDDVRRIHRLEKNSAHLAALEKGFFEGLRVLVEDEKKKYLVSLKEFSPDQARSFSNLKKIIEEIFLLRQRKILHHALVAARGSEGALDHLTEEESHFCFELVKLVAAHQNFLDTVFGSASDASLANTTDLNKVSLRISSPVPGFVGADMLEYGPFGKGEKVLLPPAVAELLESRSLAVREN
ncbi:MAG: DNA replication complex GINS family protein [Candidatus Diapherotrites archaeon]|nr:DNA replication complex GINS family protein [Candidatus Diapherotrites archaeon]